MCGFSICEGFVNAGPGGRMMTLSPFSENLHFPTVSEENEGRSVCARTHARLHRKWLEHRILLSARRKWPARRKTEEIGLQNVDCFFRKYFEKMMPGFQNADFRIGVRV